MPEPFDVTNHAGNMAWGVVAATALAGMFAQKNTLQKNNLIIDNQDMSRFRRFGTAASMGVTAALNCLTETKWAVQNLPFADLLRGRTADPLDAIYSVAYAGVAAALIWKKRFDQSV